MKSNLIIIDGSYHLHRFYNGIPRTAALPDGTVVNAVYGFMAYVRRLLRDFTGADIVVVFDTETGTNDKVAAMPGYKQDRTVVDDSVFQQIPIIKNVLKSCNITCIEDRKHEADDVIASIAAQSADAYRKIYVASNDHDFFQLIDKKISVLREIRGTQIEYNGHRLFQTLGIRPKHYRMYLALKGDASDNIKGIPGIGPVTARKLIDEFGSIKRLLKGLDTLPGSLQSKINGKEEYLNSLGSFFMMKRDINLKRFKLNTLKTTTVAPDFNTNDQLRQSGYAHCFEVN